MEKLKMNKNTIYKMLRMSNDINAIKKGKIGKRFGRRLAGRISGKSIGKFFK